MTHLDKQVEDRLFDRLATVDPKAYEKEDPRVSQALTDIAEIEEVLDEWIESASKGEVTPAAFAKIEKGLRARVAELRPLTYGKPSLNKLPPAALMANWGKMEMREKRTIIRGFLKVTVMPTKKMGMKSTPEDNLIEDL